MCSSVAADIFLTNLSRSLVESFTFVRLVIEGQYLRAVVFFPFSPH